ncbi:SIS domain-containing protein [Dendrothele bispora CBS 962.96]|uniref:SIS domain-containing protein n=1 Tax=Dendrothele bispora (strain CBS 962.96) TaxID=1314807 RepID=A0A4S8LJ05_DENBC|nr:SIS domain-containing protein [Dendrothele bispora CBS 962.96]
MGAGTSGRLGILDSASLPSTFSANPNQFIALIAGGNQTIRRPHTNEGVEDSREAGIADLEALLPYPQDTLIGITASGRTPYVLGALARAKQLGLLTVGLVSVRPSAAGCEGNCEYVIDAVVGPEVVTGSTRMKAGTATKMILNMISTGVHIKLGHTYGNLMIDIQASNTKLVQRARRIIRSIASEFTLPPTYSGIMTDDEQLDVVVRRCSGSVKLALVVIVSGWGVDLCKDALERRKGFLKAVLEDVRYETVVRVFKN